MAARYTILRNLGSVRSNEPFAPATRGGAGVAILGGGAATPDLPEPKLETEDLSKRDLLDLSRDTTVAGIARVMPTKLIEPQASDVAAQGSVTWGIEVVGASRSARDGSGVVVGVLDTGIDASHAAFNGVHILEQDFSGDGNGDVNGHGTHCAGTIFGRDVDGIRIGIARGVTEARIGKVLGNDGSGDSDMMFRGMNWAVEQGVQIISMSLGFDFPGLVKQLQDDGFPTELAVSIALEAYRGNLRMFDALMDMIRARAAFGSEVVIVGAAGNESRRNIHPNFEIAVSLPAAAQGIISVGALGQTDTGLEIAWFSNTLPQVSAPGVDVISARAGGGTVALNGTSMACPHVAGCAALWWEEVRNSPIPATAQAVTAKLLANARSNVFAANVDVADRGAGLVMAP
jgi:subtilisin family serine protease